MVFHLAPDAMDQLIREKLPHHVAIIMDGNGRWARKRHVERIVGHEKGIESAQEIVRFCRELGIKIVTLYAFSVENWKRPKAEIRALMQLMKKYLLTEAGELRTHNVRVMAIGNLEDLPAPVVRVLQKTIDRTKHCDGMIVNVALSYGGRDEIIKAIRRLVSEVRAGKVREEEITETLFSKYLFTHELPDPDLLIRTSGEMRLSNFLLWQMAYTEIYVTETLWPDFKREDMIKALLDYQGRERRFGRTSEQLNTQGTHEHA